MAPRFKDEESEVVEEYEVDEYEVDEDDDDDYSDFNTEYLNNGTKFSTRFRR